MNTKTNFLIFLLAVSCGAVVANIYYTQPIIQFISTDLHIASNISGLLTTLTQIGYGAGLFFLVPLADLYKSKRIIVLLIGLTILSLIGALFSTNGMIFLFVVTFIGIGASAAQMLVPLTMKIVPKEQAGNYIGKVMSGLFIGIMVARPFSIAVTDWLGWRMVFLFSCLILVTILLLLLKFLPDFELESNLGITYPALLRSMLSVLKETQPLQQRAFYHACIFATFSLYWTVLPILLRSESLHFTNNEIALFGFVAIAGALLTPYIGKLGDKGYIYSMTNVSMVLVVVSIFLLFFVKDHSILSIALIVISGIILDIGVSGNMLLGQKVIFSLNPAIRNRLNGLYMTIFFLGGAFGSWIGSYSYYQFSPNTALLLAIAFPMLALLVHLKKGKKILSEAMG
ncbi:MFS transporter [Niallia circulans]|uniref:MFS transporter n=1 Tax=Niallia circulans TaxID=1397 RepID=A0A268FE70_NIACI|nr:MFS transporter [Niallia circulans]AYV67995.1 MFS transporter [Niallia circulans]AYV73630.1 MFS transporter [Niallia circulans]PAD83668.1 MFS transporter [Niallia circulans]